MDHEARISLLEEQVHLLRQTIALSQVGMKPAIERMDASWPQPTSSGHDTWAWNCTLPDEQRPNGDARDVQKTCSACPPEPTSSEVER